MTDYNLETFTNDYAKEFAPAIRRASVGFLSILHPQLLDLLAAQTDVFLQNFGEDSKVYYDRFPGLKRIKNAFFASTLGRIRGGEAALTPHLAKGITSLSELGTYLDLLCSHKESYNPQPQSLLIYPGTFDPVHYGHRLVIASLLDNLGPNVNLAVNVNSFQARKPRLEETYEQRFADLEYRILKSIIIDPYKVCAMDFRFGAKEGEDHLRQTRLQSFMTGDNRLRWVIGGDKFLSEMERKEKEESQGKIDRTLSRFHLDDMTIYVVPRKGQDKVLFARLVTDFNERYPAQFICINERNYKGVPISSSLIRKYRSAKPQHKQDELERMESIDLLRTYGEL